jgi:hypothetical protein
MASQDEYNEDPASSQNVNIGPRLAQNKAWESLKDEIYQMYIQENKTLLEIMRIIEQKNPGWNARYTDPNSPFCKGLANRSAHDHGRRN